MTIYLVNFSDRLAEYADATRAELRKWGATNLWDNTWIVNMDPAPQDCLPGFLQTESAIAIPLSGTEAFFCVGRAAGIDAQLTYTEQVAPLLRPADIADEDMAVVEYCNGGEAFFAPIVYRYRWERRNSVWATDLCRSMARNGSDKAIGWHTYTPFYQALLIERAETVSAFFELGLGTNNVDTPSNMGVLGKPGASLRGWREFFPNAKIYGADVDKRILFREERIETYFVDQSRVETFYALWRNFPDMQFDVFLDDGLHTYEAAALTLESSIKMVKPGGLYIIEDVLRSDLPRYLKLIDRQGLAGMAIDIKHAFNTFDNCLVIAVAG